MIRKLLALVTVTVLLITAFPMESHALTSTQVKKFPFSAVAYMEIEYKCGCTRRGTGAMISRYGLITAGHNVLCSKHNQTAKYIDFWFGYFSKSDYLYRYDGSAEFTYYCDFSGGYNSRNDIAFIIFKKDVGEYTGWFGYRTYSNASSLAGASIRAMGYNVRTLKQTTGKLVSLNQNELTFTKHVDMDSEGGPVYVVEGGEHYLVGIYTSSTSSDWYMRRLTANIVDDMKAKGAGFK